MAMNSRTTSKFVLRRIAFLTAVVFAALLSSCTVTVWDANGVGTTYLGDGSYIKQWPSGYMKQYFPNGRTKVLSGSKSKSSPGRKPKPKSSPQSPPANQGPESPASGGSEEIYVPKT